MYYDAIHSIINKCVIPGTELLHTMMQLKIVFPMWGLTFFNGKARGKMGTLTVMGRSCTETETGTLGASKAAEEAAKER